MTGLGGVPAGPGSSSALRASRGFVFETLVAKQDPYVPKVDEVKGKVSGKKDEFTAKAKESSPEGAQQGAQRGAQHFPGHVPLALESCCGLTACPLQAGCWVLG